jgi:hypothetical protein
LCEAGRILFWIVRFGTQYNFAPKLKKQYDPMTFPLITGLLTVGAFAVFFYKTTKMDITGSIIAALVCAGVLALLIAGAISAGQILG